MIEFNSPLGDKERINQLNKQNQMLHPDKEPREIAGYNKSSRKWFFNENIVDFEPYIKWLNGEQILYLRKFSTTLSQIFLNIDVNFEPKKFNAKYKFVADVYSFYKADNLSLLYVTDSVDGRGRLRVIVSNDRLNTFDLADKRVVIIGQLSTYKGYGEFQFIAEDIQVLSDKTKYRIQLDKWQQELKALKMLPDSEKINLSDYDLTHIGVISNNVSGKGYYDFKSILKNTDYTLVERFMPMTATNIAKEIHNLQYEVDCICIVRGGGSKYELLEFNNPILIKAISDSSIPILTAVGHTTDYLLCNEFADYNAQTPTALANYLKGLPLRQKYAENKKQREKYLLSLKNDKTAKEELIKKLYAENERLQKQIDKLYYENEELQAQLKKSKKGFFSRIFGG